MSIRVSIILLLLISMQTFAEAYLFELKELATSLTDKCSSYTAMIRADPDDSAASCITFSSLTEGGNLFCGSFASATGLLEVCFDYFGKKLAKNEDSGGFIGLYQISNEAITWLAGASRLNDIDGQTFQYLEDSNSWDHYCIQKSLTKNQLYKLVLQDYKNAGSLTKDAMFKNIVVNQISEIDEEEVIFPQQLTQFQQAKQQIMGALTSSNVIDDISLTFKSINTQLLFQLHVPNLQSRYTSLKQSLYLLPAQKDSSCFIEAFNPQYVPQSDNYIQYEQMIDFEDFQFNNDSSLGYPCNITNNIKICYGILYFYYDISTETNRFAAFSKCQAESLIAYNFQLRVNLSSNSSSTDQISQLTQISKIPCSSQDCNALVGTGEQVNVTYTIKMCKDSAKICEPLNSNIMLWSQDAVFYFSSEPAIQFQVYKAYIYLPDYESSSTGLGQELNLEDIVTLQSNYGYLQVKYKVSSKASTVGTSVSLKFLIKQKVLGRMLEEVESITYVDLSNIEVLDENQTISYLNQDEEFKIVWWFWLMIGIFVCLIALNIGGYILNQKKIKNYTIIEQSMSQIEPNRA